MEDNAMKKMNKDDLCTALIDEKLIDEAGTVNADIEPSIGIGVDCFGNASRHYFICN